MLLVDLKLFSLILAISGCCCLIPILGDTDQELPHRIYRLLDGLSSGHGLSASSTFALLLSQFLIKREPNEPCTRDTDDGCSCLFMPCPCRFQRSCATWRPRDTNDSFTTICCTGWSTSGSDRVVLSRSRASMVKVRLFRCTCN